MNISPGKPRLLTLAAIIFAAVTVQAGAQENPQVSDQDVLDLDADAIQEILPAVTEIEADELLYTRTLSLYALDGGSFRLAPVGTEQGVIRRAMEELEPRMAVETVFVTALPTGFPEGRAGDLALYNLLRRVSTMTGIEYYSASRGRMRIFYHDSYAVDDIDRRLRQPDPVVRSIPRRDTILVFQRDSSFGENVHELEYRYREGNVYISMVNRTLMWYGIIPAIAADKLEVHLWIQRHGDLVIFYGNTGVAVPSLFGIETRAHDSFHNRLIALFNWFQDQLRRRYASGP